MNLRMHPGYERLVAKAQSSHDQGRNPSGITTADVGLARLYSYAFRLHSIGAFHATRLALRSIAPAAGVAKAHRDRAVETLGDLVDQGMEPVPDNFLALISTFHRYHRNIARVCDSLEKDHEASADTDVRRVGARFGEIMGQITSGNGIHLTRDTEAPEQASFIVPNLGITIVPLVYGEHHSWNLAYLSGQNRDVPTHRHQHGAEIHLGYGPMRGLTILGSSCAQVDEGYAMPIPPETDHGYVNTSDMEHHLPFIFGSMKYAGWGIFLDVEPRPRPLNQLAAVGRENAPFEPMVYLEREIARAERMLLSKRWTLIPAYVTNRHGSGGLEFSISRCDAEGLRLLPESFRAVSVVRGRGIVSIEGIDRAIEAHDHCGIPAGMNATIRQTGAAPLVVLDALIKLPGRNL